MGATTTWELFQKYATQVTSRLLGSWSQGYFLGSQTTEEASFSEKIEALSFLSYMASCMAELPQNLCWGHSSHRKAYISMQGSLKVLKVAAWIEALFLLSSPASFHEERGQWRDLNPDPPGLWNQLHKGVQNDSCRSYRVVKPEFLCKQPKHQ